MLLHLLPFRTGDAAQNMAADFLLLQRYPDAGAARFRHYSWHSAAISFGYGQRWDFVAGMGEGLEKVRRPTGGGVVDHTADWTYCLVLPKCHPAYDTPAGSAYLRLHRALAGALASLGRDVLLQPAEAAGDRPGGHCFQQAEPHDVIDRPTGAKVAGAAMKRNKNGLLFQGSIARPPLEGLDWEAFGTLLPQRLAEAFDLDPHEQHWPDLDPTEEEQLIEQFSSPEWNRRR